jgi:heptosyltransferase-3
MEALGMATTNEIRNWPLAALDDDAPRIALVSYDSLGDGLVYLMMAENLRLNGFDVTYYGNCIHRLAGWFPQLAIRPYPEPDRIESELKDFDLVLYSPPSFVRHRATEEEMRRLAERYVMICVSRNFAGWWRVDHTQRIEKELPPEKSCRLRRLASCSGSIRHRLSSGQTVVQATLCFMQKDMGLERVTPDVELRAPVGLVHRRHRDRVVLCPDSAVPERKDWTPSRILHLAARLKSRGLDPKIVASPENIATWQELSANVCESPALHSVDALAAYLYESGAVVASDSGSGHLASFLRVPTVTIHRRMNRRFAWRPGWGPGVVVCPLIILPAPKTHIWRPCVPTVKIVEAVEAFCSPAD